MQRNQTANSMGGDKTKKNHGRVETQGRKQRNDFNSKETTKAKDFCTSIDQTFIFEQNQITRQNVISLAPKLLTDKEYCKHLIIQALKFTNRNVISKRPFLTNLAGLCKTLSYWVERSPKRFRLQQRPLCECKPFIEARECCATFETWLLSCQLFQRTKSLVACKFNAEKPVAPSYHIYK